MKDAAEQLTKKALETQKPLEIIENTLMPALDKVGKGFEKGTLFLPQLMMSADAAKEAFAVVVTGETVKYGNIILKKGVVPVSPDFNW